MSTFTVEVNAQVHCILKATHVFARSKCALSCASDSKSHSYFSFKLTPTMSPSRTILFIFLIPLFLPSTSASRKNPLTLPNPQQDPANICGRFKPSAVCDPDGNLSEADADNIDGLINFIQAGTHGFKKPPCSPSNPSPVGAQLAVAIVQSLPRDFFGVKDARAFQYAEHLHDLWGVGDPVCQNGVVIVFAVEDRAMGFSVGKGVNNLFSDAMLPSVMSDMRPLLQQKEYGLAIVQGITVIGNILSGAEPPLNANTKSNGWPFVGIFAVIGGGMLLGGLGSARNRRRYNRCKDVLRKIDRDRVRASSNNYVITSCPICLEDFDSTDGNARAQANGYTDEAATRVSLANKTVDATKESEKVPLTAAEERLQMDDTDQPGRGVANGSGATEEVSTLPCGHKFHESCILLWLRGNRQANSQCPVCRQPIDSHEQVESRTNNGAPSGWDVYDSEYSFRMRRTRHYYPDFVTWTMLDDWNRGRYNSEVPMATSVAFTQVDPAVVAEAARASGSGGSSFSFGGGSSAGGGGGGGGW